MTISPTDSDDGRTYAQAIGRERSIVVGGQSWTIREAMDRVTLTRTLIFFSTNVARRVREYPADWRDLPDELLYELSWSR